jgi:hypothetical protein
MKAISTKYHGPTNTRGSRISATDGDTTIFVSYHDDAREPHDVAALALCKKLGWSGTLIRGGTKTGNVYVWAQFGTYNVLEDSLDVVHTPRLDAVRHA